MSRKSKVKWTDQMNEDLLECKRKAQELITSTGAPVNGNGRKKGYIEIMKNLWDAKGYGDLGLKPQNLRDQASRLEKIQERSVDNTSGDSRAMSGIDESMFGVGTQSASNIDHSDSADLFTLDFEYDQYQYGNPRRRRLNEADRAERSRQCECTGVSARAQCC